MVDSHSPRSSYEEIVMEASPSRYRDVEFEEVIERPRFETISRPRSVSVHSRRRVSSPVRYMEPRFFEERIESDHAGSMVLVRPRSSENDVRDLERDIRTLQLERQGGIEITRERDMDLIDSNGNEEEITELSRSERRRMCPSILREILY